jgi:hypothetical protein
MPHPTTPLPGRQHICGSCGNTFRCKILSTCSAPTGTKSCPKCDPKNWARCGSCSGQFHDGICHKCQLFRNPVKTYCPACGKKHYTRQINQLICHDCSTLPYALVQSMIYERTNQKRDRLASRTLCGCNNCRG